MSASNPNIGRVVNARSDDIGWVHSTHMTAAAAFFPLLLLATVSAASLSPEKSPPTPRDAMVPMCSSSAPLGRRGSTQDWDGVDHGEGYHL